MSQVETKSKPRKRALRFFPVEDIRNELVRRGTALLKERENLLAKVDGLNEQISAITVPGISLSERKQTVAPRARHRKRSKVKVRAKIQAKQTAERASNPQTMSQILIPLLAKKPLSIDEIMGALKKAGYKSSAKNPRLITQQGLCRKDGPFQRVAKGVYGVKLAKSA